MIWFTSDTHFGHKNIIKYCNRPFSSMKEMDEVMIENWNKRVGLCDTVYHLGDVSMGDPMKYLKKLNGHKRLIKGNHDIKKWLSVSPRDMVSPDGFKYIKDIEELSNHHVGGKQRITLCHYQMRTWNCSHYGAWQLFGHVHEEQVKYYGKQHNVGVDNNNFAPVSMDEIIAIMDTREDNPDEIAHKAKVSKFKDKHLIEEDKAKE